MRTLLAFTIGIMMLVLAVAVTGIESYDEFQDINWDDYLASLDGKISINPFQNPVAIKDPEFQVPDLHGLPIGCDATKMPDISEWYTMPNQPIPPAPKMPEMPEIYAPKMEIPQSEMPKAVFTQPELPMPTELPTFGTAEETHMAFVAQGWLADYLDLPITSADVIEVTRGGCFSSCRPDAEVCVMVCVDGYIVTFDVSGETYKVATNGDESYLME